MGNNPLLQSADNGQLVLHMNREGLDAIMKACDVYIDTLQDLVFDAKQLSQFKLGFAEDHLDSGRDLARAFQRKAAGDQNCAENTFQSHIEYVEGMKTLFRASWKSTEDMDHGNARSVNVQGR
ncbi:hypothetical protein FZI91_12425 [Mycobacterium sp. CBMA271]|uniref:hypothetical protein n=1 Tax=unclassified Mycobacteroides TaxID=2618759 RepID=UPI0012DBEB12|nr:MULTISPECIES: hypothetical protein [unclassified Mycobacteroides]MUM16001.1 hypothetical protein [Mycobacteroides sp. CBMA 326]MUM22499.1 hypothetical protein [Mycobacteroides sp. CBMA 271]